jgi:hypothetical protein
MPENFTLTKTGTAAIIQSAAGITKVFCIDGDPETITAFYGDDSGDPDINAGITGTLDLSGLTGMRTVRARNQSFTFVPGTWVQNASVSIDISNSITTAARVTALVDSVIIANGGTTTDDGSNYTGSAGNTFASRTLTVGTIELDLGDPENTILYEKIVALGTKGWTVSTVSTLCEKQINFDTLSTYYAITTLEKTRRLISLDYVSGQPLDISLYDNLGNANTGGATGLLASGFVNVNTWMLNDTNYNAWTSGADKAIRLFASNTGSTLNKSNLRYFAAPTATRLCGEIIDVLGLNAYGIWSSRNILQALYSGNLYVTENGADTIGNRLDTLYDQSGNAIDLERSSDVNTADKYYKVITDNVLKSGITSTTQVIKELTTTVPIIDFSFISRIKPKDGGTVGNLGFGIAFGDGTIAGFASSRRFILATSYNAVNSHTLRFDFVVGGTRIPYGNIPLVSDQWYVAAFTYKRSTETLKIYLDGVLTETLTGIILYTTQLNMKTVRLGVSGQSGVNPPIESTDHLLYQNELNEYQVFAITEFLNS